MKKPSKKDLALTQFDPPLMGQINKIADLVDNLGENPEANVTIENVDKAVEVLARVREAQRKLVAACKEATKPFKDQAKPFDAERLALEKRLKAGDAAVAERLIDLYVNDPETMMKRMEGALGSTATFVERGKVVRVIDADKIPDHFINDPLPRSERVNTQAIIAMVEAGQPVPDGVTIETTYSITTKASELIKRVKG